MYCQLHAGLSGWGCAAQSIGGGAEVVPTERVYSVDVCRWEVRMTSRPGPPTPPTSRACARDAAICATVEGRSRRVVAVCALDRTINWVHDDGQLQ